MSGGLDASGEHTKRVANHLYSVIVGREADAAKAHYFLDYIKSGRGFISIITKGEEAPSY